MPFWAEFDGHRSACIDGETREAAVAAAEKLTGCRVTRVDSLPYPAYPQVGRMLSGGVYCSHPQECRGWGYCRHSIACSE